MRICLKILSAQDCRSAWNSPLKTPYENYLWYLFQCRNQADLEHDHWAIFGFYVSTGFPSVLFTTSFLSPHSNTTDMCTEINTTLFTLTKKRNLEENVQGHQMRHTCIGRLYFLQAVTWAITLAWVSLLTLIPFTLIMHWPGWRPAAAATVPINKTPHS